MLLSPEFLSQLRRHIIISNIVKQWVHLKGRGNKWTGLCPFHQERTPSFTVNDDKGFFYCFGCGAHGDAIEFLIKIEKSNFSQAITYLASQAGLKIPQQKPDSQEGRGGHHEQNLYKVLEQAACWFEEKLRCPQALAAREYLEARGIAIATASLFRIGWAPDKGENLYEHLIKNNFSDHHLLQAGLIGQKQNASSEKFYERFRGRIMFPIIDSLGRVVAFGGRTLTRDQPKYLNSPETPLFSKNQHVYGMWQAKKNPSLQNKPLIIVEGYLDVISLQEKALARAVAPLGTTLSEEQFLKIWTLEAEPFLAFDGDKAGQEATRRTAEQALSLLKPGFSIKLVDLPQGEDPHSLVQQSSMILFQECLQKAQPLVDYLWQNVVGPTLPKTPEQKALKKVELNTLLHRIQDPGVRNLYSQDFWKKWNSFLFPRQFYKTKDYQAKNMILLKSGTRTHMNVPALQQKILLATLINHPKLIEEVAELLAELVIPAPHLSRIRELLLRWVTNSESISLPDFLNHQETETIIQEILCYQIYTHAHFAKKEKTLDEARIGWHDIFQRYQYNTKTHSEVQNLQNAFQTQMSEPLWYKIQHLKYIDHN